MKSSWEITKQRSKYHFDTSILDPRWDVALRVGHIKADWSQELQQVIDQAYPVSWRTRGKSDDPLKRMAEEYDQEEYDLDQIGIPRDYKVTDMNYKLTPMFESIAGLFGLDQCMARIHVQRPGQVWNLHLDKLEKWMPSDPSRVVRYFIQLTDWQPGHFWSFGNYCWSGWKAGDVVTFDWLNVPHSTANAGMVPRATLQLTGVITERSSAFVNTLSKGTYEFTNS